jgi:aminoglycoside/choline kinase family phosphotransferase
VTYPAFKQSAPTSQSVYSFFNCAASRRINDCLAVKVVGDNLTSAPPGSVANLTQWVSQRLVPEHAATGERATGRQAMGPQESASEVDDIRLIAGDASPRKYYRVRLNGAQTTNTVIAVESPPTEKNEEFLRIRELLAAGGVRVPALIAADIEQGYLLLEDLGDETLLPHLSDTSVSQWYGRGLASLANLARINPAPASLEAYSAPKLMQEMRLFTNWFIPRLLTLPMTNELEAAFSGLAELLIANARAQPQVLVHRDFHSRNLMVIPSDALAVIDFQDAVIGPVTYDPVSLLKDCYIRWPRSVQLAWLASYQSELEASGVIAPVPEATFIKWFDLMGLQRHIKVLGIFSRLAFRDGKPDYLQDLPRVIAYVTEVLDLYAETEPALAAFKTLFDTQILPVCAKAPWFRGEAPE